MQKALITTSNGNRLVLQRLTIFSEQAAAFPVAFLYLYYTDKGMVMQIYWIIMVWMLNISKNLLNH